ncbi:MAG TPA: hypothetical protein VH025_08725 [Solirubrobacteraceae bacterium]|nr:hypothetical protein [Solirubrobacteraceae bacterium]
MANRSRVAFAAIVAVLAALLLCATAMAAPQGAHAAKKGGGEEALPPIETPAGCEFIANPGNEVCMLPFPDDFYTVADPTSATGRRIAFKTESTPTNVKGEHVEAAAYNAADGFSPGSVILAHVPGLQTVADVTASKAVPINKLKRYKMPNTSVVVIDATTGQRWPIWVEIDSTAKTAGKADLEIHPAVNFTAGDRYIVALRNLKNAAGEKLQAPAGFRYFRDNVASEQEAINERRPHFEELFSTLEGAGVGRSNLYLAWDFTVASDESNTKRELAMRNDAFAQLGDTNLENGVVEGTAPTFTVSKVENEPNPGQIARRVQGTFVVPCYMTPSCASGGRLNLNAEGLPVQNGTWTANFDCIIPLSATTGPAESARPSLYGHGLFGDASEVASSPQRSLSQEHDIVQCATDEIGMSESDVFPTTVLALQNASAFPAIPDRLQQGLLDELYLGRLLDNPAGFASNAAFHQDGTTATGSVLNTSHLFYNGNSQGGIMGGALTAVSPDFTRASLGVPGMNYSVLLPRSVDFAEFAEIFYPSYPNETSRPVVLDMMQMLWDRGEPDGYADRMTSNPLPDTPAHQVLMDVAFGDHQVTDFEADVEARTIGAHAHKPVLYPGRWPNTNVLWDVPGIKGYPYTGSAIYYWDIGPVRETSPGSGKFIGVEPPPYENLPNESGEDPHGSPRAAPAEQQVVSDFFDGSVLKSDNCGKSACFAGSFTGP